MDIALQIKHWDDGTEPYKEVRLYTMSGKAIGYGKQKLMDNKIEPDNNPQGDLFADSIAQSSTREVTYIVTLDLSKLAEGGQ